MKSIFTKGLIVFLSFFLNISVFAQSPFIELSLETVDNSAGVFTNGEITYRLYAELNSGSAKILQIFADETRPHLLATTTTFYQDAVAGANLQQEINSLFLGPPYNTLPGFENVGFDSWVTIGDNYDPATLVGQTPGFSWTGFDASSWSLGGTVNSDAALYRVPTDAECLPDANNKILLGQFTTSGVLSGYINLAGLDAAGNGWDESNIPIPQIQVSVLGCTDSTAFNYDASANTDDGSCIAIALGCIDVTATNYDPLANTDDGSCIAVVVASK